MTTEPKSETPITDAEAERFRSNLLGNTVVPTNFARALERAANALADALVGCAERLQITLVNREPMPKFDSPPPTKLENIKAIANALGQLTALRNEGKPSEGEAKGEHQNAYVNHLHDVSVDTERQPQADFQWCCATARQRTLARPNRHPHAPMSQETEKTPITDAAGNKFNAWSERDYRAQMRGSHLDSDDPQPPNGWETARAIERAANAMEAAIHKLLASAHPNQNDHPTMFFAWCEGESALAAFAALRKEEQR